MATGEQRISLVAMLASNQEAATAQAAALEREHAPVAAELERDPAVVELELAPAVAVPEHAPAAAELERDPAVAVPAQSRLRARLAAALRTKSVIAAHHPGQVPLLAVEEDLGAAVAETTRVPAAAEAVIAWAAADTVAVEAEAAVTEPAAVVEDAAVEDAAVAADAEDIERR